MGVQGAAIAPALVMALIASGALVFGSALPTLPLLHTRFFHNRLTILIGFSAGLMLATALHELLPAALEAGGESAMWGAGAGFLILYLAERLTHFHACQHRDCEVEEVTHCAEHHATHLHHHAPHTHHAPTHATSDSMALTGMGIHNLADGLTMAAAFSVSRVAGLTVILAIVLHQMAVGLSLSAIMLRVGRSHRRVLVSAVAVAAFIVLGVLAFYVLSMTAATQGIVLGLAGGSFLYVAACDLLPEAHTEDEGWVVTAVTLLGYGFVLLLHYALE